MSEAMWEIICNRCRSSVAADVEVCPSCGTVLIARLDASPPAAAGATPVKPRRKQRPAKVDRPKRERRGWRRRGSAGAEAPPEAAEAKPPDAVEAMPEVPAPAAEALAP
jgi:hypothetical protein